MKLDSYHYQEVIHMTDFVRRMIDDEIRSHHVLRQGYPFAIHDKLSQAQDLLGEVYEWLANEQDLIMENK